MERCTKEGKGRNALELSNNDRLLLNWRPLISFGLFKFGFPLTNDHQRYKLKKSERPRGSDDYQIFDSDEFDLFVSIEEGVVDYVSCRGECYFNDINLIGVGIDEALSLLRYRPDRKPDDVFDLDWGVQQVWDLDEIEAQVWELHGRLYSISVRGPCSDE